MQRQGFIQALHLSSNLLTLNVQTKSTTFYPEILLLDFIIQKIGQNRIPSEQDYKNLSQILKGCHVVTQQSNWTQAYVINRFDRRQPHDIKIDTGDSLIKYYENVKNIQLRHTRYRCLEVYFPNDTRKQCHLPIEKINYKNGGINFEINLNTILGMKKFQQDSFMFFGADVLHPTSVTQQHPSIAAVVASGNSQCSMTATRICQQYPKQGKCSLEIIIGMEEMVVQLLKYNQEVNKRLPTKVVFYRDGIDDGQFSKIIAEEIPAIRKAFDRMYGEKSNHPLLTFIVVKKRHNTRFFKHDQVENTKINMLIGTVIDTKIVHPYQYNFYLNSHKALQGVNRPSLYHVLLDEIEFTTDELQLLTYYLCFTDQRSSTAEAIPSLIHQADLAALKARDLVYNDDG
ncbi:unnamed protein product [Rotaria sp. Silwood2]|nr:unnamed protein product [Rotaria sp. Silwood2]